MGGGLGRVWFTQIVEEELYGEMEQRKKGGECEFQLTYECRGRGCVYQRKWDERTGPERERARALVITKLSLESKTHARDRQTTTSDELIESREGTSLTHR